MNSLTDLALGICLKHQRVCHFGQFKNQQHLPQLFPRHCSHSQLMAKENAILIPAYQMTVSTIKADAECCIENLNSNTWSCHESIRWMAILSAHTQRPSSTRILPQIKVKFRLMNPEATWRCKNSIAANSTRSAGFRINDTLEKKNVFT